jgi:hypothetical protein
MNDKFEINQYHKDNINELNLLCSFLIDEFNKAEEKQKHWFEKYWRLKKKINTIKDVVDE